MTILKPIHPKYADVFLLSPKAFEQFLKEKLTANQYEELPDYVGVSHIWWPRLLNQPNGMRLEVIRKIAEYIGQQPYQLVKEYGLGIDSMSAGDILQLQAEFIKHVTAAPVTVATEATVTDKQEDNQNRQ